jgi:hypothetical protein
MPQFLFLQALASFSNDLKIQVVQHDGIPQLLVRQSGSAGGTHRQKTTMNGSISKQSGRCAAR